MKTVAIIPARYQSKRFHGKPLALIAGIPMIQHVFQRAKACPDLDGVYVATDDLKIYDRVQNFGGEAIMTHENHQSGTDRIAEAAETMNLEDTDIVVNIQGDQPIFQPFILSELIGVLINNPEIPVSTLMYKIRGDQGLDDTNKVKVVVDTHGYALYFSRLPIPFNRDKKSEAIFYKHIGIYAYRKSFLSALTALPATTLEYTEKLEQLRVLEYGYQIKMVETTADSLEVDTPEDLKKVEEHIGPIQES